MHRYALRIGAMATNTDPVGQQLSPSSFHAPPAPSECSSHARQVEADTGHDDVVGTAFLTNIQEGSSVPDLSFHLNQNEIVEGLEITCSDFAQQCTSLVANTGQDMLGRDRPSLIDISKVGVQHVKDEGQNTGNLTNQPQYETQHPGTGARDISNIATTNTTPPGLASGQFPQGFHATPSFTSQAVAGNSFAPIQGLLTPSFLMTPPQQQVLYGTGNQGATSGGGMATWMGLTSSASSPTYQQGVQFFAPQFFPSATPWAAVQGTTMNTATVISSACPTPSTATAASPNPPPMSATTAPQTFTPIENLGIDMQPNGTTSRQEDSSGSMQQLHQPRHVQKRSPYDLPMTLFMSFDEQALSDYQCLLRKQIEMFEASEEDVQSCAQGRNTPLVLGQVGIRCRYCASIFPVKNRPRGSIYYFKTVDGVYQVAQNMSKLHFGKTCQLIPKDVRAQLESLQHTTRRASGGKEYWAECLRVMGVYEERGIIRFRHRKNDDNDR